MLLGFKRVNVLLREHFMRFLSCLGLLLLQSQHNVFLLYKIGIMPLLIQLLNMEIELVFFFSLSFTGFVTQV